MTWALLIGGWACSALAMARLAATREATARATHEVRGPLTAALLALHGADAAGDRVRALAAQLERALRALDDLSGSSSERVEPIAAPALMASIAEAWGPVAAARGRVLHVVPAAAGPVVLGDRVRLAQAVGNLVANALEHGSGTITVRAHAAAERLRIEVRDEGPGLRRPVTRLSRGRWAGLGARGRGLRIAADVAAAHGGRLSAAPSASGATLVVDLPLLGRVPSTPSAREALDR